ncbi:cytochrome P450 [Penicillium sp. DV-2018c]|nr:cytochrome P450 [Penicillium sp. DV-2018c]
MLVTRLLALNFVGNRTSSVAFTHAIWSLVHCESQGLGYWASMREEVEKIFAADESDEATESKKHYQAQGARWMRWSKSHTAQMNLIESFLKESLRYNTDTNLECKRMIVDRAGYRFKNGVHLKKGTVSAIPIWQIHHDPDLYPQPEEFDARRFYQNDDGAQGRKPSIQTTSDYFLAFGAGKHACPGRFFASQHLKLLMAFLVMNYEIQPVSRPDDEWFGSSHMPNMTAGLTIRARQD